ncbi:MAG: efflux RND transporter permease subunit [Marinifilaceae bacterium]
MNLTEFALKQRAVMLFAIVAIVIGGVFSFFAMGKLEDAEIPVKAAVVVTQYPGASPHEVELQVTEPLEKAIQAMEGVDFLESRSMAGYSEITVNLKSSIRTNALPQVWDVLRKKVYDASGMLPQGAYPPIVADDFGDVYGIFLAVSADGYSYEQLRDYARFLKRELLLVDGVKRINIYGERQASVYLELSSEKMAHLGVHPGQVIQTLNEQNKTVYPGALNVGSERIRIASNGTFKDLSDLENLLIQGQHAAPVHLKDIATIRKGYMEPITQLMSYNREPALGMSIAMERGGNVIELGEAVQLRLDELMEQIPVGIKVNKVFYQPERVQIAINDFMVNLIESVLIVVFVLLLTMGLRSGLLIGSGLLLTILASFIVMLSMDITLQRVSLAAIIIAMGMLVDNAIVIADGILVDLKKGMSRPHALRSTSKKMVMPLLGATVVAILAFLPIYMSPDGTGEFCASLFEVIAISLMVSWILALTQTPYFSDLFLKVKSKKGEESNDPYGGKFYQGFRRLIKAALYYRKMAMLATVVLLVASFFSFQYVKQMFFPNLAYNQFIVEYYLPEGSDSKQVQNDLNSLENYLLKQTEVLNVTTSLGATPARYTLARPMNNTSLCYGELIVDTEDYETVKRFGQEVQDYLTEFYPQAKARVRYYNAISSEYQIEAKFSGPDPVVLRDLAEQAQEIMEQESTAQMATNNWRNQVKVWNPDYYQARARRLNVTRGDLANALAMGTEGLPIGVYHEGENQLPVLLRTDEDDQQRVETLENMPIWGSNASSIPLRQVVSDISLEWEDPIVWRYDRRRAIKAQCDPAPGYNAPEVLGKIRPQVEAISLPEGYELEWLGEYKTSSEANENMFKFLPLALLLMCVIIIALFNGFKQPLIIALILPLAFIGISFGLLITGKEFGFMAIVGALGLMGMMIKNAVVLLDQIDLEIKEGKAPLLAIIDSAVSRMRPVVMASFTTILGMIPLISDDLFGGMAVAIMFGLLVGTLITLIIVPLLYSIFFKVSVKTVREV